MRTMPSTSRAPCTRSPTVGLIAGLVITLAAVLAISWYITRQISTLRALQTDLVDRSRKDSLQLLRIQNDLNTLALAMRDMLDDDQYPLTAWSAQFDRVRRDLADALAQEERLAVTTRTPVARQPSRSTRSTTASPLIVRLGRGRAGSR